MNQSHDDNSIPSNSPKNTFSSSSTTHSTSKTPLLPDQDPHQRETTHRWRSGAALLILLMLVASLWVRPHLADGSKFPIHWGIEGQPNGYGTKNEVLYLFPGIAFLVGVVFELAPLLEPRKSNLRGSLKEFRLMMVATLVVLSVCHSLLLVAALKIPININAILQPLVGLVFMFLGNSLGKLRSNFLVGIRTPWTLSSEKSWVPDSPARKWAILCPRIGVMGDLLRFFLARNNLDGLWSLVLCQYPSPDDLLLFGLAN